MFKTIKYLLGLATFTAAVMSAATFSSPAGPGCTWGPRNCPTSGGYLAKISASQSQPFTDGGRYKPPARTCGADCYKTPGTGATKSIASTETKPSTTGGYMWPPKRTPPPTPKTTSTRPDATQTLMACSHWDDTDRGPKCVHPNPKLQNTATEPILESSKSCSTPTCCRYDGSGCTFEPLTNTPTPKPKKSA